MASTAIEMTVKKITGMTTVDLETFAKTSALAEHAADELTDAIRSIGSLERSMHEYIAYAQRDLDNALSALDAGHRMNEHGVLQGTALNIDQLAARRQDAYDHLNAACRMVKAVAKNA